MFQITCLSGRTFYYDVFKGLVYDESFYALEPLAFPHVAQYTNNKKVTKRYHNNASQAYLQNHTQILDSTKCKDKHIVDLSKVRVLDITFGMRCNYKCKYCLQAGNGVDIKFDEEEFYSLLKPIDFSLVEGIRLWGGEPIVYWKRLQRVVSVLRRLGYKGTIHTVTNGSIFSLEKANYCLENNIHVVFSHDGPAQKVLRNSVDYLDDLNIKPTVLKMLRAGKGHISLVLSPYNCNVKETLDWFEKKLYPGFPIKLSTVFKADTRSKDILKDYGAKGEGLDEIRRGFLWGLSLRPEDRYYNYFNDLRRQLRTTIKHLVYKLPYVSFKARCPSYNSYERLAIDTEGNILGCYADGPNNPLIQGNIKDVDNFSRVRNVKWDLKSIHQREMCLHCPYVAACMGGCPLLGDEDHRIRCQSVLPWFQALFEAAFKEVYKEEIVSVQEVKEKVC